MRVFRKYLAALAAVWMILPSSLLAEDPKSKGLGISRDSLQVKYENLKFRFETAPLEDGTPRLLGSGGPGHMSIELTGPPKNLSVFLLVR